MCIEDTIDAVKQSIEEDPNKSIYHHTQQLELCLSVIAYPICFMKDFVENLGFRAYKIQLVQEL